MSYQKTINSLFTHLNESPAVYPPYPPYHTGPYLEERFVELSKDDILIDRYLIPVFWTNVYKQGRHQELQIALNKLDPNKKYYCVCTHDDAPLEILPKNTLVFRVGTRHQLRGSIIPPVQIPCTASPIPFYDEKDRDIKASFVGSYTHPIRGEMARHAPKEYAIYMQPQWSEVVTADQFSLFEELSARSKFVLCPRGYAATSVRMYETFQYGAIPVYISDDFILPWEDEIDWSKLVVKVTVDQLPELEQILDSYSEEKWKDMVSYGESVYQKYFFLDSVVSIIQDKARKI
tara:strand:+ start:89 stop:958 length:870 start_codon:yes stop_codon:yes gene_type:complete